MIKKIAQPIGTIIKMIVNIFPLSYPQLYIRFLFGIITKEEKIFAHSLWIT
ncbi:hypothetical protein KBB60_01800 [Patescibacteria group bacterium]|nr:hypothetical protein [Patescibacteria group bacterium]